MEEDGKPNTISDMMHEQEDQDDHSIEQSDSRRGGEQCVLLNVSQISTLIKRKMVDMLREIAIQLESEIINSSTSMRGRRNSPVENVLEEHDLRFGDDAHFEMYNDEAEMPEWQSPFEASPEQRAQSEEQQNPQPRRQGANWPQIRHLQIRKKKGKRILCLNKFQPLSMIPEDPNEQKSSLSREQEEFHEDSASLQSEEWEQESGYASKRQKVEWKRAGKEVERKIREIQIRMMRKFFTIMFDPRPRVRVDLGKDEEQQ